MLTLNMMGECYMTHTEVRAIIQARMSSTRFPGKVLAPLWGRPLIDHVVKRVNELLPLESITVSTSTQTSDDPLALYLTNGGVDVHRGSLDDVVTRFQECLADRPCNWFLRVCGDSPLLDVELLRRIQTIGVGSDYDLVTNVFPRSNPVGQSGELVRTATFQMLNPSDLTHHQREHATRLFYDRSESFQIHNVKRPGRSLADQRLSIDSIEDLKNLNSLGSPSQAVVEMLRQ